MSKINNKTAYPFDTGLSLDDFVIGSDADNADVTRNYLLRGIFSTFQNSLGLSSLQYIFAGGSDPELDHLDAGYFTTNGNETVAGAVTSILINKLDLNNFAIASYIDTITGNLSSFTFVLSKPSAAGQIFYYTLDSVVDNTTHYTFNVTNFVGGNTLVDETTYTTSFDLSGVPSVITETDTLATVTARGATTSVASSFTSGLTVSAVGTEVMSFTRSGTADLTIGNSGSGNLTLTNSGAGNILIDGAIVSSILIGQWNTAYGWGNHASAGYLTSYTETDPVFTASDAFPITTVQIASWDAVRTDVTSLRLTQWDTAFGWGNHASAGYITSYTETDPVFLAHAAAGVTTALINEWNTAYTWGDHDVVGYVVQTDMDTLAELNVIVTDATLVDLAGLTSTVAELNLLDLAGLTAGWVLSADSAAAATWKQLSHTLLSNIGTNTHAQIDTFITDAPTDYVRTAFVSTKTGGDLVFNDSIKAAFGTSSDMLIFHNGVENYIQIDVGDLIIREGAVDRITFGRTTGDITATGDVSVADEAYGIAWNSSTNVPTKNAIYDKIESLALGAFSGSLADTQVAFGNTTADSIQGSANLTYDGNHLLNKNGWVGAKDSTPSTHMALMGTSGTAGEYVFGGADAGDTTYTSYLRIGSSVLGYWNGTVQTTVWHAGNDGSGSGLDADTLRTFSPTTAATASTIVLRDSSNDIHTQDLRATHILDVGSAGVIGNSLRMNGTGVGTANVCYAQFNDSGGTRQGYIGFPSASNSDMVMLSDANGDYLLIDQADSISALKWNYNAVEYTIWHSGNDGSGSGLDADTLDGFTTSVSGNRFGVIPVVGASSGVMEIGRYIDFHASDADTSDTNVRLDSRTAGGGILRQTTTATTDRFQVYNNATDYAEVAANASGGFFIGFTSGTNMTLYSYQNSTFGNTVTSTNFILSSDRRMKENIRDIEEQELDVRWRRFDFTEEHSGEKNRYGVIAQELQKTHPEFVVTNESTGLLSVKYTDLLIAKMAEKDRQMAEKDRQIESLEKRIDRLEGLIGKLTPSLN